MIIRRPLYRLSMVFMVIAMLVACGAEPDAAPVPATEVAPAATDAPAATESPTEPVKADEPAVGEEPTTTPQSTGEAPIQGSIDGSGARSSDLGFRPETDGFSFPNYGGQGETNLTPDDLRRLFGDQVCVTTTGGQCVLTPPGNQWLQEINQAMSGGHCEGMAVLSNLFYTGKAKAADFGADSVPALQIEGNEPLQREIAYWWATQSTQPARSGIVAQTPSGVVNTLLTSFAAGPTGSDQYAVGIYKRDGSGGHAITPYAVEDKGDGVYWIMVYDNNYPGIARAIEVNTKTDTWMYSGSTNPAEAEDTYEGDADTKTLELAPIGPRLDQQQCPFCDAPATSRANGQLFAPQMQASGTQYNQIWLQGSANLLITDLDGNRLGFDGGKFINEIPGAKSNGNKFGVNVWDIDSEPVYYIPTNIDFTINIDGSQLTETMTSTVTMIGPGYALEVSDIVLEPGQVDTLDVSPDGSLLSYRTTSASTPFMLVAIETDAADYLFGVYGEEMAAGEALNLVLDTKQGWLSIDSIDNTTSAKYSLEVVKYDDQGEQVFGAEGIELAPDDVIYVDYLKWPGNGQPMALDVDRGADGSVDETLEVADITDTIQE